MLASNGRHFARQQDFTSRHRTAGLARLSGQAMSGAARHCGLHAAAVSGVPGLAAPGQVAAAGHPGGGGTLRAMPVACKVNPYRSNYPCKPSSPGPPGSPFCEARHVPLRTIHDVVGSPAVGRHPFVAGIPRQSPSHGRRNGLSGRAAPSAQCACSGPNRHRTPVIRSAAS